VEVDGRLCAQALPGRQGRLILIYLALHHDRPVSRDELADAIWGDHAPRTIGASLNALISKLRGAVGPDVIEGTGCLQLAGSVWVDVDDLRRALADASARLDERDYERARERAAEATDLAGRGLVPDHQAEWLEDQRREVEELRLQALECLGEAALGLGGQALADARRAAAALISASAYRESGYLLMMRALSAQGNAAEAVRVYHDLRRTLDDELGILPSAAVQELVDHLLTREDSSLGSRPPPPVGADPEGMRAISRPHFATRMHGLFVGRERELMRLRGLLEQARLRRRQLVLLQGEPGVGKTRLAEQFAASCQEAGVTVLAGRCDAEAIVPYQPFIQALRPCVSMIPVPVLRDRLGVHVEPLSSVLPELAGGRTGAAHDGDRGDRYRLFEAICALLTEVMAAAPAVLILDDLHWADKPTLLLLRHVVRVEEDAPLLIMGIYRDTEREAGLLDALADLRREHFFETIPLSGLDERDASKLIAALCDRTLEADHDLALWRETKGNPFFLEELVRHMGAGEVDVSAIPEGVRSVIRRRLGHRSENVNRVLTVAAVAGSEFSIELLERVRDLTDLSEDELYDAVDEAVSAQLVLEHEDYGRFAFCHSLMRQTIYEDLTLARRGRLHLRIGEALELLGAETHRPQLAELAHHFLAAPPSRAAEKATRYAIAAGREATRMLAYEEAERLYRLALLAMERHGAERAERLRLLLALGDVQVKVGATEAGRATFAHALALARDSDDADAFALAALGLGARSYMAGGVVDAELIAILEEALERLPSVDSPLRARLLGRLADELSFSDRRERCTLLSEQAVAIARRVDDPRAYSFALTARHWCLWGPQNLDDRLAAARELLALGERTGQNAIVVEGHRWCMLDLLERGDIAGVDAEIDAYMRIAHERRLASEQWYVPLFDAMRMLFDGRLANVERTAGEALHLGTRVQPANAEQAHTLQLLALRREQGRLAEMEEIVRARATRYPAIPGWRCVLAYLYAETGRTENAADVLDTLAAGRFRDIPHDGIWLGAIAYLAEACAAIGAHAHAAALYDLLAPYSDRNVVVGWAATCTGSAARHLGMLATMLGRHETAAAHFEQAIAMNRAMGARPWLVSAQLQYAQTLLANRSPRDQQCGVSMLRDALASAQEVGLTHLADGATRALRLAARRPEPSADARAKTISR